MIRKRALITLGSMIVYADFFRATVSNRRPMKTARWAANRDQPQVFFVALLSELALTLVLVLGNVPGMMHSIYITWSIIAAFNK